MAVNRLEGKVDSRTVAFTRDDSGQWFAVIPADLDGEYIVEVTAYDDAGNSSFTTSMLFTVDLKTLVVKLQPPNFATSARADDLAIELQPNYATHVEPPKYTVKAVIV